jgi:hypothetical protein
MYFVKHAVVKYGEQKQLVWIIVATEAVLFRSWQTLLLCQKIGTDIIVCPLHDRNKSATGVPVWYSVICLIL